MIAVDGASLILLIRHLSLFSNVKELGPAIQMADLIREETRRDQITKLFLRRLIRLAGLPESDQAAAAGHFFS